MDLPVGILERDLKLIDELEKAVKESAMAADRKCDEIEDILATC